MEKQNCPQCYAELLRVKHTTSGYLIWNIDHYELSEVEVFINCPQCGKYLNNEYFEG